MGIRAGYCVTETFHFRHKQHTAVWGQKGLRETPGGPGEIIPPSILRHAARFLGGLSRSVSDHTWTPGMRMTIPGAPRGTSYFWSLPKIFLAKALNPSVPQFPKCENKMFEY